MNRTQLRILLLFRFGKKAVYPAHKTLEKRKRTEVRFSESYNHEKKQDGVIL